MCACVRVRVFESAWLLCLRVFAFLSVCLSGCMCVLVCVSGYQLVCAKYYLKTVRIIAALSESHNLHEPRNFRKVLGLWVHNIMHSSGKLHHLVDQ